MLIPTLCAFCISCHVNLEPVLPSSTVMPFALTKCDQWLWALMQEYKGYIFKIMGGQDKQGFGMKQGVLTPGRVALLMTPGDSCFRGFGRRSGERRRKSVRGCIVSQDLSVLNLAIVKKGGILQQYCCDKDLLIQHHLVTMSCSSVLCKVLLCALCIAAVRLHQWLMNHVHIKLLRMWLHQCSRLDCMCLIGRLLTRRSWRDSWADRHRQAAHAWPQACIQDPQAL